MQYPYIIVSLKKKTLTLFRSAKDHRVFPIAIGKQGQNVRLASKLTGYDIDIELSKAPAKKKKQNVEDSLLSAIEEANEE